MTAAEIFASRDSRPVSPDAERERLLSFYDASVVDERGGFNWLSFDGTPLERGGKDLWLTARLTYCYALAELAGHRGAAMKVEHGLNYLNGPLRDSVHGGWLASTRPGARKEAYGHAHVMLAAAASARAGHEGAETLVESALAASERFREPQHGLYSDTFSADWTSAEGYRGANANMHMTEALLAAGAALNDREVTNRAVVILDRILGEFSAAAGWRVPEHFTSDWVPDPEFNRENPRNPFRPYGSTLGHWYEWARLSIQAWAATGAIDDRHVERAVQLYRAAEIFGLREDGSVLFTVTPDGRPFDLDRYHWPVTEAIGAASALGHVTGASEFRADANHFWSVAARDFIDLEHGSWIHQLDPAGEVTTTVWEGKPDLYHTLQATLVEQLPLAPDFASALIAP